MITNVQNNVNFGSLKISPDKVTRRAISNYIDCLDTARIMHDSFAKIGEKTGEIPVLIKGDIIPDKNDLTGKNFSIVVSALRGDEDKQLGRILIAKNNIEASRSRLLKRFTQSVLEAVKKGSRQ